MSFGIVRLLYGPTKMAHPQEGLLREAYDALAQGDTGPMLDLLAEQAMFRVPALGSEGVKTRAEALRDWERLQQAVEGTYRIRAHAILADDEHAVVLEEHTCKLGEGRTAVYHLRDGRIVEGWYYPDDPEGMQEFSRMIASAF